MGITDQEVLSIWVLKYKQKYQYKLCPAMRDASVMLGRTRTIKLPFLKTGTTMLSYYRAQYIIYYVYMKSLLYYISTSIIICCEAPRTIMDMALYQIKCIIIIIYDLSVSSVLSGSWTTVSGTHFLRSFSLAASMCRMHRFWKTCSSIDPSLFWNSSMSTSRR